MSIKGNKQYDFTTWITYEEKIPHVSYVHIFGDI